MRSLRLVTLLISGSLALYFGPLLHSQQATAPAAKANVTASQLTREQMEQFLLNARILGERSAGKGITGSKRVVMTDGTYTHDAHVQDIDVFKAEYRTHEGVEKNFRDSYKFNIAAYRLDKMMDLNIVPVCVPREVNGKPAAVDWWVDNVSSTKRAAATRTSSPRIRTPGPAN